MFWNAGSLGSLWILLLRFREAEIGKLGLDCSSLHVCSRGRGWVTQGQTPGVGVRAWDGGWGAGGGAGSTSRIRRCLLPGSRTWGLGGVCSLFSGEL